MGEDCLTRSSLFTAAAVAAPTSLSRDVEDDGATRRDDSLSEMYPPARKGADDDRGFLLRRSEIKTTSASCLLLLAKKSVNPSLIKNFSNFRYVFSHTLQTTLCICAHTVGSTYRQHPHQHRANYSCRFKNCCTCFFPAKMILLRAFRLQKPRRWIGTRNTLEITEHPSFPGNYFLPHN